MTRSPSSLLLDLMGHCITSHRELPNLRHRPRHSRQGQFPFPGLAGPSLLRNLLDIAGALAGGVGVVQGCAGIKSKQQGWNQEKKQNQPEIPMFFLRWISLARGSAMQPAVCSYLVMRHLRLQA